MGVFGKKSTPAGTTAEDADFASKAASMREAQDAQQLKTFTRWWNSVLKPRGVKIEDLVVEVSPGVNPIMLYEELSGTLRLYRVLIVSKRTLGRARARAGER